jgi:hypothetical protein
MDFFLAPALHALRQHSVKRQRKDFIFIGQFSHRQRAIDVIVWRMTMSANGDP